MPLTPKLDTVALARRIRLDVIRMTNRGKSSHVGSALSIADILATLYGAALNVDPFDPQNPDRDRFILSKGHAGAAVYAALAETGFFDATLLEQHYQNGSIFSGHVSHKGVPGVELSTGALGHGLNVATGMALAAKRGRENWRAFALLGDGECDEGSTWEAAMFAAHHSLDNLVAIIDYNKLQSLASVADTLALEPFADKWRAFGWAVEEIDGHDHAQLLDAFDRLPFAPGKPGVLIAHTTKGKGVSFMENQVAWHYRTPLGADFDQAISELESADA
ncbi:transketolase [Methylocystis sp. WRRC1]|uniref:transketolase n=1 Tax=Methylocystis sp. WRRC1 TaxID=1732014 RepID=UPI001D15ACD8|nr:transketolase [Methylocystis sp. WRRC1]MCC3244384.1 transketolase [Methylocystis sp. WRRC1]